MSLQDAVTAKANALAQTQATNLSTQMATALTAYQTTLVNQAASLGITLATPLPFTDQNTIYQWLLPMLQQAFIGGLNQAANTALSAKGYV